MTLSHERFKLSLIAVLGLLPIVFILLDNGTYGGRALNDQHNFYYPAVLHFFNGNSVQDYPAAMTPGYFYFLSYFTSDLTTLRIISSLFSTAIIAMTIYLFDIVNLKRALVLLPIYTSVYFLSSSLWISPDNTSFLCVIATLSCYYYYVKKDRQSTPLLILISICLLLSVLVRQTNLYLVAVFACIELMSFRNNRQLFMFFLATIPALAAVIYFVIIWQGLTPPSFSHHENRSFSLIAIKHFFVIYFFYGFFYFVNNYKSLLQTNKKQLAIALTVSFFIMLILGGSQNSINSQNLMGGLVNFANLSPSFLSYNLFELIMSTFGLTLFYYSIKGLTKFDAQFVIVLCLMFIISLIPNTVIFDRYYMVFIYILLIFIVYKKQLEPSLIPILMLCVFNFAITIKNSGLLS